jgi:hypothetical protein
MADYVSSDHVDSRDHRRIALDKALQLVLHSRPAPVQEGDSHTVLAVARSFLAFLEGKEG